MLDHMRDGGHLRLSLDLDLESDPVSGHLVNEAGDEEEFSGWLAFFAALQRLEAIDRSGPAPRPPQS